VVPVGLKTLAASTVASTALVAVAGLFVLDATAPAMAETACNPVSTGHTVICGSGSGGSGTAQAPLTEAPTNGGGGFTSTEDPVISGHGSGGVGNAPAPLTEAPNEGGGGVVISVDLGQ
jgi:hypothetical protein